MTTTASIPWYVSMVQLDPSGKPQPGYQVSKEFGNWLQLSVVQPISAAPSVLPVVALTGQTAAIGITPMPTGTLSAGTYRVSYYAAITTADAVSSSLTVTLTWTENTLTKTLSGAAMTGNTTTTVQSSSALIVIDGSPVSYSTAYASNTPGAMVYRLTVLLEAV